MARTESKQEISRRIMTEDNEIQNLTQSKIPSHPLFCSLNELKEETQNTQRKNSSEGNGDSE